MDQVIIVGGGIAGLTAAYRLERAGVPYTVIFDQLGGRIHTEEVDNAPQDMGAEYFLDHDSSLLDLINILDIEIEPYISNRAIYDLNSGKSMQMPNSADSFINSIRKQFTTIRYLGISNLSAAKKLSSHLDGWIAEIEMLYQKLDQATIDDVFGPSKEIITPYADYTLLDYLTIQLGMSEEFVMKMIDPLFRAIYMLGSDELTAVIGVLGFAAKNSNIYHVKGGNKVIINRLYQYIQANAQKERVTSIKRVSEGAYKVLLSNGSEISGSSIFLATPLQSIKFIELIGFEPFQERIDQLLHIPYNPNVHHHLIQGIPNSKIGNIFDSGADTVFIANPDMICEINQVDADYFDVTSTRKYEDTDFTRYFDQYTSIRSIHWSPAYPLYNPTTMDNFPNTPKLAPGLYMGTDNILTTMGTSVLIANLISEELITMYSKDKELATIDI